VVQGSPANCKLQLQVKCCLWPASSQDSIFICVIVHLKKAKIYKRNRRENALGTLYKITIYYHWGNL